MTSFYPAINGRATSQLGITRLLYQIHHDQSALQDLQTQLSTGRRISSPSQDPAAAIRAFSAQRQLEYKSQVDNNLTSANTLLAATESTLSQSQSILNEMRGVALQAVGSTLSAEESEALANQIQAAINKLADLGNSKFRDQYIFAGSNVLSPPLKLSGNSLRFSGDAEELKTISDFASTIAANVTANEAFGVQSSKVVSSVDLNPRITTDTRLSALNRGDGIRGGAISLSNGVDLVEIDLATAHSVSDVIEKIQSVQVGGRDLQVTLSSNGINLTYTDGLGGLLKVDEVGSGTMAGDLGIKNTGTSGLSPVVGSDLNPITTKTARLSDLFGGAGITIGDTFRIEQGGKTYVISTNSTTTLEDVINRIHSSGAQVRATLDPTGRFLQLQSTESGTGLSIGENGNNLATQLGLRTMSTTTPVSNLNFGQGIFSQAQGNDLVLQRTNGTQFIVNLDGVQNVGDVLGRINNHVDNFVPSLRITASLATVGNGIVLSAQNGSQPIQVMNAGGSQAAWGLGLVARDQTQAAGVNSGTQSVLTGADISGVEVDGVFTTLLRMQQAIENGKSEDMIRLTKALDTDIQRMALARGVIGTRQQSIDQIKDLSAEQQLQLKEIESNEIDADLAQVISEMSARQAALEASLKLMGSASQLSLFNYL